MKHVVAGALAAGVFLGVFILWVLLGELIGPAWAIVILLLTLAIWVVVAYVDYLTEGRSE